MRKPAKFIATLGLLLAAPAGAVVPVADVVYDYGPDSALAPLDKTFQIALIDAGWLPLTVAASEITAEARMGQEYAKVRIRFGDGKATFTLLQSENLSQRDCRYAKDGKGFLGQCIDQDYYDWLARIVPTLPVARAKVVFLQSLADHGGGKP